MKISIIFDTFYGNTQKVAELYRDYLKEFNPSLVKVDVVTQEVIDGSDLLILGAPTRAFNMTKKIKKILKKYKYKDKYFVAFDTRARIADVSSKLLLKLVSKFGYAAEKIEHRLIHKEALKLMDYQYYFVKDTEGPLIEETTKSIEQNVTVLIEKIKSLSK